MAKITETFGYGPPSTKKESPPLKKPLIPTEPKTSKTKTVEATPSRAKTTKKSSPAAPGVKKWDFSSQASSTAAPPKSTRNIDVDPELDGMLAQLEMDEDFMKLSDNEQIAWLESLFFLDTPSKQACSGLVKPRPKTDTTTRLSRSTSSTSKSLSIQTGKNTQTAKKPEAKPEPEPEPEASTSGGLSKDKCALAMSFFANDGASTNTKKSNVAKKAAGKANDDDLPAVQNATAKPFFRERAYYEPDDLSTPEEEEDILPTFKSRPTKTQPEVEEKIEDAPPVPERSGDPKVNMLRRMKNVTGILRS